MKRLICRLRGHVPIQVSRLLWHPGAVDGVQVFAPDPAGNHTACLRCRDVLR